MNGQLPPTDPVLREQLARRSAGRLPERLLAETYARLDAAPQRARRNAPRALRIPRLVWAGAGLTAAVLLAVAVALPALRPAPAGFIAGYPAQRALTTAELAELMAGPELAQNTAIVATVTIQARTDVCPMNSRPTVGVIEGMRSQVCVMGSDLSARLVTETKSGTFAFRYMAPGYLGLITEIEPAASRLAFSVSEDWLDGSAFLVEGYLGATDVPCAAETEAPGDYLFPYGYEQCRWSWLSDDGSPAAVRSLPTWSPAVEPTAAPSIDWLALDGKARHVEAGGAREIDSIPAATTHGVYVVAPVTGPCPGSAPYDSRGCPIWRVLAKVPELSLGEPATSPTPSPTPAPTLLAPDGLLAPANEALTLEEVVDIMRTDPDHMAGWTVVIDAPFGSGVSCPDEPASPCGALKDLLKGEGTWAVRIGSDGMFGIMGEVQRSPRGKLVSTLTEAIQGHDTYPTALWIVDAWMRVDVVTECLQSFPGEPVPFAVTACPSPLQTTTLSADGKVADWVAQKGAYAAFIGTPTAENGPPVHDLFLLSLGERSVLSRFPIEGWTSWPSVSPPATPQPEPSPTSLPAANRSYAGLIGEEGRPLTTAEFADAWAADPAHLADRIAIVKGPVPTGFICWDAGAADVSAPPNTCHLGVLEGQVAPEGYWVVRVGSDGELSVLGELKMNGTLFVWSVDQVLADKSLKPDELLIVQASLRARGPADCPPAMECIYRPEMISAASGSTASLLAGSPPYGAIADGYKPVDGLFLIRTGSDKPAILAAFALAYPPD